MVKDVESERSSSSQFALKIGAALFLVVSIGTLAVLYTQLLQQVYEGKSQVETVRQELNQRVQEARQGVSISLGVPSLWPRGETQLLS